MVGIEELQRVLRFSCEGLRWIRVEQITGVRHRNQLHYHANVDTSGWIAQR